MQRPRIAPLLPALAALALLAAPPPATASPACPPDSMRLYIGPIFTSTAATYDTTLTFVGGTYRVTYDLAAGWLHFDQCCSLAGASVKTADAYDVVGVPTGTPVSVTALLTVNGSVSTTGCGGSGCGGYYAARLQHGVQTDEVLHSVHLFNGSASFQDVLQVPLTITAGSPETIFATVWGARNPGGAHASQATGVLSFTGLPAGASVVSCQGFGLPPVPVRATSWGRLKTIYR